MSAFRPPLQAVFKNTRKPTTTTTATTFAGAFIALSLAALAASSARAQGAPSGQPPGPPPEAYTACKGLAEGASVTLTMPDGKTLPGTCRTMNGTLVAMPAGGPPHGAGGPPPAR